jgi:hypothetical protein
MLERQEMRKQTHMSDEAFGLLADLVGGQVLRYAVVAGAPLRTCRWTVGGRVIDREVVLELNGHKGLAALIWPDHFDHLDDVPFHVTAAGYAYVRSLADA